MALSGHQGGLLSAASLSAASLGRPAGTSYLGCISAVSRQTCIKTKHCVSVQASTVMPRGSFSHFALVPASPDVNLCAGEALLEVEAERPTPSAVHGWCTLSHRPARVSVRAARASVRGMGREGAQSPIRDTIRSYLASEHAQITCCSSCKLRESPFSSLGHRRTAWLPTLPLFSTPVLRRQHNPSPARFLPPQRGQKQPCPCQLARNLTSGPNHAASGGLRATRRKRRRSVRWPEWQLPRQPASASGDCASLARISSYK